MANSTVQVLHWRVKLLWAEMCHYDGIAPDNRFAVFSPGNPYQPAYDKAMGELQREVARVRGIPSSRDLDKANGLG